MNIGYYYCTAKVERNATYLIHVVFNYDVDWPENVLRQRSLLGNRFCERTATEEEVEITNSHKRARSMKYQSIALLLEDERRACPDPAFLARLEQSWRALKIQQKEIPT